MRPPRPAAGTENGRPGTGGFSSRLRAARAAGLQAIYLALLLGLSLASARGSETCARPLARARSSGGATQWMSPSVVATWLTQRIDDGPEQLELLVLWRGAPGWFLRPGNEVRSENRSPTVQRHTIVYGEIRLTLDYDHSTRSVVVDGRTLTLDDHNVILVDEVNSSSGPRVVRTLARRARDAGIRRSAFAAAHSVVRHHGVSSL